VRYDVEFTTRQYLIYHTHAAGYIQRRLIKALEDVVVRYDGTGVLNLLLDSTYFTTHTKRYDGSVIQFCTCVVLL